MARKQKNLKRASRKKPFFNETRFLEAGGEPKTLVSFIPKFSFGISFNKNCEQGFWKPEANQKN